MPSVTGLRCASPSLPTTITDFEPSSAVTMAESGTFHAWATVLPVIDTFTGVPTLSFPDLLSIFNQTSTVVEPGSSAGLTMETLAGTGSASSRHMHFGGVPDLQLHRKAMRDVRLGQQRGGIHHSDQRRTGGSGFAGE